MKSIHDKYGGRLTGEALLAEGTPVPVVQALTTILGISLVDVISPSDYIGGLKMIYSVDPSVADARNVELVALSKCSIVQVRAGEVVGIGRG